MVFAFHAYDLPAGLHHQKDLQGLNATLQCPIIDLSKFANQASFCNMKLKPLEIICVLAFFIQYIFDYLDEAVLEVSLNP